MKKFTLLASALGIMLSASAQEGATLDSQGFKRLTADELNAVETSHRIAIRCTRTPDEFDTYYTGTNVRIRVPVTEDMIFDWVAAGDGKYYIKKTFAEEGEAYLQNTNLTTFGSKESATVAKFTAVNPTPQGSGVTLFGGGDCFESPEEGGAYYVRLSLGDKWFNFNGYQYNSGTGVWTVQNIVDLSEHYRVTVNMTIDGATISKSYFAMVGEEIDIPEYSGYVANVSEPIVKTADDNQVVDVTYTYIGPGTLVTDETLAEEIVDGAIIALMAVDKNSPDGTYFKGGSLKNSPMEAANLYKVVGVEGSENGEFYLQQYVTGKYVGGATTANSLVLDVDDIASANAFTAAVVTADNWPLVSANGSKPDRISDSNTIRFTTNGTFLNTNNGENPAKYFTGTSGFSVWYVYTFTAEEVQQYVVGNCLEQAELYLPFIGEGVGKYSGVYNDEDITYETYSALIAAVKASIEGNVVADILASASSLTAATEALALNMPEGGKFYRIKNNAGDAYLATGAEGRVQFAGGIGESAGSLFYFTGTKMIDYSTGYYLSTDGAEKPFMEYTSTVGEAAGTSVSFAESPTIGKYNVIFNGSRYLYSAGEGDSNAGDNAANAPDENYRFEMEEVDLLPVAVNPEDRWTTVFSPVVLGLNGVVKAYCGKLDGNNNFVVEEQTSVPANVGVLLKLEDGAEVQDGYVYLPVQHNIVSAPECDLTGAVATFACEDGQNYFTLSKFEDGMAFVKTEASIIKGFTACIDGTVASEVIRITNAEGNDITTSIDEIELVGGNRADEAEYFDLNGRRVVNPVGGLYIKRQGNQVEKVVR